MICPHCGHGWKDTSTILPDGAEVNYDRLLEGLASFGGKIVETCNDALKTAIDIEMRGKIEKLEKLYGSPDGFSQLEIRLETLEDHYRHSSENLANEVLSGRIEKLENKVTDWPEYLERKFGKEEHRALEVFGMGQSEVYAKWADRIEKLENDVKYWKPPEALKERLEKLERPEMEHIKENRKNIIELAPQLLELGNHDIELRGRIEKLEEKMQGLMGVLEKLRDVVDKEMEE